MPTSFQQTNAAAGATNVQCSGNSQNTDRESNQAQNGGTAGSTPRTVTMNGSAADLNAVWHEIVNIDSYNGGAGNWTWRINITTSNHQITLDEVHICHVSSAYAAKNTLGSATGLGINLGSTGVQSGTINQASGVTIAAGDKIIVIFAFDNGNSMSQDFAYTPDQIITGPGNLSSPQSVTPGAIASAEAFGSASVGRGAVAAAPSGIATAEAFGAVTIAVGAADVSPAGLASAEAFGSTTITTGAVDIAPGAIPSAEAFGSHTVSEMAGTQDISPAGIATAEAHGSTVVAAGALDIAPGSVDSAEAHGATVVTTGAVDLAPGSIASLEAFGGPAVAVGAVDLAPGSIVSLEAFGGHSLSTGPVDLSPSSIASDEAFGTHAVGFAGLITPVGMASAEMFGNVALPGAYEPKSHGQHFGRTFGATFR